MRQHERTSRRELGGLESDGGGRKEELKVLVYHNFSRCGVYNFFNVEEAS